MPSLHRSLRFLIAALLIAQQGASLRAFAGAVATKVKAGPAVVASPVGAVGTAFPGGVLQPLDRTFSLSNPSLLTAPGALPQIKSLSPVLPAAAVAGSPALTAPVVLSLPAPGVSGAGVPPPLTTGSGPAADAPIPGPSDSRGPVPSAERLGRISQTLQPDLSAIARTDTPLDSTAQLGERVMETALGRRGVALPALSADVAAPQDDAGSLEAGGSWWKDPASNHVAVTVPIYALRRESDDPGVGKFTDLGTYYRDVLAKQGADVVLLLPHFAVLDESPYAAVSLDALNEDNIDWAEVAEVQDSPDLLARLVVTDLKDKQSVNYKSLRARESAVAREAYLKFEREHLQSGTGRAKEYQAFLSRQGSKLQDYAEYMALARLIGKPSLQWTTQDERAARQDPSFPTLVATHLYSQWNAFRQFRQAMDTIHDAGGKVLFDVPMFRSKNSVDTWKHPEYFTDLKTRNPGVVNQWVNEDWKDLALWNWTRLKGSGYRLMLDPFRSWLEMGLDGARVDALHFAYDFGNGQLASGDEPGDDYVAALSSVLKAKEAFPLAEAFEGKADNALRLGFVTVYGDWKKLSTHDDPRSDGFMGKFLDLSGQSNSGRVGRFVGYTLGDEWADPLPVKEQKNGRSSWSYRIPMPSDPDYKSRARADWRGQLGSLKAAKDGDVWKAVSALWQAFKAAGDAFVKHFHGTVQIWAASMDWFLEEWGRDTFISLPGLLLSTGRYDEARENMRNFARYEHHGLIPNKIWDASRWSPQKPDGADYNTVDGSLWFVQAVKKYVERTGDWDFAREMLPVLRRVIRHYTQGTGYQRYGRFNRITMDADGLIVSPGQATWMDADPEGQGKPVTPRNGKAVEINALWYADLRFVARLEGRIGDRASAKALDERADLAKKSFNDKFWFATADNKAAWGGTGGALRDVVEGDLHGDAIRPNMLFAVSHGEDLLTPERQSAVVLAATKDLLTPYGLRTLSPRDSNYHPTYETWKPPLEKDQAYHQGTVWPWLIGAYVDALARVRKDQGWDEGRIREEIRGVMTPLVEFLVSVPEGSLPEVFDGGQAQDALKRFSLADPLGVGDVIARLVRGQHRGGTRSQAWSVAEVMRVLQEHGLAPGSSN